MAYDDVSEFHGHYSMRRDQWIKVRDCLEGEDAVKNGGVTYLPRPGAQDLKQYAAYKGRAVFYAVAERTQRGLLGLVFRNMPVLKVPKVLEPRIQVATADGYAFDVWCMEAVAEVVTLGRYGILVDFPEKGAPAGSPPYFSCYKTEDIRNWEEEFRGDKRILTRVCLTDDLDVGNAQEAERILELTLEEDGVYRVQKWVATAEGTDGKKSGYVMDGEQITPTVKGQPLNYIPFVFINPYDLKPGASKPPFADLANMNLAHYRNSADYEHALYLTAQPTPWIAGKLDEKNKPKSIGAGTIWYLDEGGSAGYLEFTGKGLEAQSKAMLDKENRMAVLGARLINDNQITGNIAADTVRLKSRADTSVLTSAVRTVEAAFQQVWRWAAEWSGANPDEVEVSLNKDFVETRLDANELGGLVKAWQSGAISRPTLHENLQRGEIVPTDRTVEEEVQLIEEDTVSLAMNPPPQPPQPGEPGGPPLPASGAGGAQAAKPPPAK